MYSHSHPEPDATAVVGVIVILISVLLTAVVPAQQCLDFLRHGHHLCPHPTEAGRVLLDPFENCGNTLSVNVVVHVTYLKILHRWHIALTCYVCCQLVGAVVSISSILQRLGEGE